MKNIYEMHTTPNTVLGGGKIRMTRTDSGFLKLMIKWEKQVVNI